MEILTTTLAIWGAILSTILAILEIIKNKRKLRVNFSYEPSVSESGEPKLFIRVYAVNLGHRPITIIGAGILLQNGIEYLQGHYTVGQNPLPKKLEDGDNLTFFIDYTDAKRVLKNSDISARAFLFDTEGKKYSSKKIPKWFRET